MSDNDLDDYIAGLAPRELANLQSWETGNPVPFWISFLGMPVIATIAFADGNGLMFVICVLLSFFGGVCLFVKRHACKTLQRARERGWDV